jgi:hypothetical protein
MNQSALAVSLGCFLGMSLPFFAQNKDQTVKPGIGGIESTIEMRGPAIPAAGEESFEMVVPAMKVANFHFSEVTKS